MTEGFDVVSTGIHVLSARPGQPSTVSGTSRARFASGCRQEAMLVVWFSGFSSQMTQGCIFATKKYSHGLRKWPGDLGKVEAAEKK
jgi:hypothetical protein